MAVLSQFYIWGVLLNCLLPCSHQNIFIVSRVDEETPQIDPLTGTPYRNCGGTKSILKSVEVIPCEGDKNGDQCIINRGANVTFKMSFVSQENSNSLTVKIYGIIDYVPIPFPCPQPNACHNSGIVCPINKGQFYNYALSAPMSKKYPKTSLWIKGELRDDSDDSLLCVEIPVKIV